MATQSLRWKRAGLALLFVGAPVFGAWRGSAAPAPLATTTPPVVKTRLALDRLAQAALDWQDQFQCSGCHKQPLTIAAFAIARSQGHDAPLPGVMDALVSGTLTSTSGQNVDGCFSFGGSHAFTMATTFAGRGLEAFDRHLGGKLRPNLLSAANCLLARKAADGRLPADSTELPVSQGDFVTTAHGAYVWRRAFERTGTSAYQDAELAAVAWLRGRVAAIEAAPPSFTTQDKAMLLAGLGGTGATTADPDVSRMRMILQVGQLGDGPWKIQNSTAGGNAHATGQAVYALRSAGFDLGEPLVASGRAWLLANQLADGSWPALHWVGGSPSQVAPSMWGALALATFPSPLASLRANGSAFEWAPVEGAETYDVIRGSLSALVALGGTVNLGNVSCLAAAEGTTSVTDLDAPPEGDGYFYLMRIGWGENRDIYGRSSGGEERVPFTGDCGP